MKNIFLAIVLFSTCTALGANWQRAQWTLRFAEAQGPATAVMGCLGTASYQYVQPSINDLKRFAHPLAGFAADKKIEGWIWSRTLGKEGGETRQLMNIRTGEIKTIDTLESSEKALVLCLCRNAALRHCTPMKLPPLGTVFETLYWPEP